MFYVFVPPRGSEEFLDLAVGDARTVTLKPGLKGVPNVERIRLSEVCEEITGKGERAEWDWQEMART